MDTEDAHGDHTLGREGIMTYLRVAERFSPDLGGRYKKDGPYSGEVFRNLHLLPLVERALASGEEVTVDFDGVSGTPTSFLEEAFGGLLRARPDWSLPQVKAALRIDAPKTPLLRPYMVLAYQYMEREAVRRLQH